jgi:hypothetical protein
MNSVDYRRQEIAVALEMDQSNFAISAPRIFSKATPKYVSSSLDGSENLASNPNENFD